MKQKKPAEPRKRNSHIWERERDGHYVEPEWCATRLFQQERFEGTIWDPACGFGNIPYAASACGHQTHASDLFDRGYADGYILDFLTSDARFPNIVCNPPFHFTVEFAQHALKLAERKVAMIFPTRRLNAMHSWIADTPLRRVWLLTPRPSMPPGHVIAAGIKPSGGTIDFCWMVWEHGHRGKPELRWLYRDNVQRVGRGGRI